MLAILRVVLIAVGTVWIGITTDGHAQGTRGALSFVAPGNGGQPETIQLYARSYALVVGINGYNDTDWKRLKAARDDAQEISKVLKSHGFEVALEEDLGGEALKRAIQSFLVTKGQDPEARLLLWFAGHGASVRLAGRDRGYLVPADAPSSGEPGKPPAPAFLETALSLRQINIWMEEAQAKHILAVFDSCFSGLGLESVRSQSVAGSSALSRQTAGRARQMITSGDKGEEVSDDGHFRKVFLEAITGQVALGRGGFVTARRLTEHLRDEMIRHTEHKSVKQRPDGGYLDLAGFREGDFVFELRRIDGSRVDGHVDANAQPAANSAQEQLRQQEELSARLSLLLKNRSPPAKPYMIDTLARRYEGQEPGHTGIDAAGNRYYGIYRLQAGSNLEEFLAYLRRFHPHFAERLSTAGGSRAAKLAAPAFIVAWKALGEVPEFNLAQVKFIVAVDYRRLIEQMKADRDPDDPNRRTLPFDVSKRSLALQAVLFSIANQLGPSTTLPFDALQPLGNLASISDERIIDALFAERDRVSYYSPEITSDKFIELYRQRNQMEKQDALHMLRN